MVAAYFSIKAAILLKNYYSRKSGVVKK